MTKCISLLSGYIITGELAGPILAREAVTRSSVKVPVNFVGSNFIGGVHTSGSLAGGKKRMILSAMGLMLTKAS